MHKGCARGAAHREDLRVSLRRAPEPRGAPRAVPRSARDSGVALYCIGTWPVRNSRWPTACLSSTGPPGRGRAPRCRPGGDSRSAARTAGAAAAPAIGQLSAVGAGCGGAASSRPMRIGCDLVVVVVVILGDDRAARCPAWCGRGAALPGSAAGCCAHSRVEPAGARALGCVRAALGDVGIVRPGGIAGARRILRARQGRVRRHHQRRALAILDIARPARPPMTPSMRFLKSMPSCANAGWAASNKAAGEQQMRHADAVGHVKPPSGISLPRLKPQTNGKTMAKTAIRRSFPRPGGRTHTADRPRRQRWRHRRR